MIIALLASVTVSIAGHSPFQCDALDAKCAKEQICHSTYGKSCAEASADSAAAWEAQRAREAEYDAAHPCVATPWSRRLARLLAQRHADMPIIVWENAQGDFLAFQDGKECPQHGPDPSLFAVPAPASPITSVRIGEP